MEATIKPTSTSGVGEKRTAAQAFDSPKSTTNLTTPSNKTKQADAGTIPMPGEDGYDARLHTLLCLGCAFRGYLGTRRQPAQRYIEAFIIALPQTNDQYRKADSQSKLRYDSVLSSVQSLDTVEQTSSIAYWAYRHAKQGVGLMYAAEPAKLQWAMAALDEFAAVPVKAPADKAVSSGPEATCQGVWSKVHASRSA
ncbi:hypothetical protein LTR17_007581 [Elasticomyces elasticus]|nr:hypothetical protein LTR17_007581 [Elasticomyces elasticus]